MDTSELLSEIYSRVGPLAEAAVDGLDADALALTPDGADNSIAWLVWHVARLHDHHMSELLDDRSTLGDRRLGRPFRHGTRPRQHGLRAQPGAGGGRAPAERRPAPRIPRGRARPHRVGIVTADPEALGADRRPAMGPTCFTRRTPGVRCGRQPAAPRPGGLHTRHVRLVRPGPQFSGASSTRDDEPVGGKLRVMASRYSARSVAAGRSFPADAGITTSNRPKMRTAAIVTTNAPRRTAAHRSSAPTRRPVAIWSFRSPIRAGPPMLCPPR